MSEQGRGPKNPPARGISAQALGRTAVPPTKSTLNRLVTDLRPATGRAPARSAPLEVFEDLEAGLSKDPASKGSDEPSLPAFPASKGALDLSSFGSPAQAPTAVPTAPASTVAFRGTSAPAPRPQSSGGLGNLLGFQSEGEAAAPLDPIEFEPGPSLDFAPLPNDPLPPLDQLPPPEPVKSVPRGSTPAPRVSNPPIAPATFTAPLTPPTPPAVFSAIEPATLPELPPVPMPVVPEPAPAAVAVAPPTPAPPREDPVPLENRKEISKPNPVQPIPEPPQEPPPPQFEAAMMDTQVVRASKVLERARETKKSEQRAGQTILKEPDAPIPPPPPVKKPFPVAAALGAGLVALLAILAIARKPAEMQVQAVPAPVQEVADPTPAQPPTPQPPEPTKVKVEEPAAAVAPPEAPAKASRDKKTSPDKSLKAAVKTRVEDPPSSPAHMVSFFIEVTPAGARVLLDGQPLSGKEARVPRSDKDHVVEVSAEGYLPQQHLLSARLSTRLVVELDARPKGYVPDRAEAAEPEKPTAAPQIASTVTINTDPAGAMVFLDGKKVGYGPVGPLQVEAGSHSLRVVRDGFQEFTKDIACPAGQSVRVDADLVKTE